MGLVHNSVIVILPCLGYYVMYINPLIELGIATLPLRHLLSLRGVDVCDGGSFWVPVRINHPIVALLRNHI